MRKLFLAAALLPLAFYQSSAQSLGQSEDRAPARPNQSAGDFDMTGFHVGLNTGIYYTQMIDRAMFDSPSYNFESTWKASPIGLTVGYNWQDRYGVQVEANLQRLGQKMTILDLGKSEVGTKEIDLTYVQIPLLFKIMAGDGAGRARFNFHIGPQLSVLTEGSDTEVYNKGDIVFHNTNDRPVDEIAGQTLTGGSTTIIKGSTDKDVKAGSGFNPYDFNKTILGAAFGFGMEVNISSGLYLTGNLRLGYNFSEIRKEGEGDETKFRDYVDLPANSANPAKRQYLYGQEARNFTFGGFQFGVHYLLNQGEH